MEKIPVDDLDDKYEVSDMANIRNTETGNILKQCVKNGYYMVGLQNKNTKKTISLSTNRIVLTAFKGTIQ
jgi:hypothetical protein